MLDVGVQVCAWYWICQVHYFELQRVGFNRPRAASYTYTASIGTCCAMCLYVYIYVFVYMQALKPTYNMCCMRVFLDVKLHKIGLYVYTPAWLYMYVYIYIHVCTQMISIIYGCQLDLYDVISRIYTICIHIYIYMLYACCKVQQTCTIW